MAAFAHTAASSPIHRGVFIARGVLGVALRPPPMAIAPLSPDLQPTLTTRERVEIQTRPEACQIVPCDDQSPGFCPGAIRRLRAGCGSRRKAGRSMPAART